jgi:signal transduction histidine kinase
MRDVGADLGGGGSGGNADSEAAARRRRMTLQLREARRSLSEPDAIPTHSTAMVRLFAEINRSATPMLGIIALGVCATALAFIDAGPLTTWITFISCAIAIGYSLPIAFLDSSDKERTAGAWRRKFVFSTALSGSAWAYLIVTLLEKHDPNAHAFAIIVMLLVSTVMSLLAAAIPAAFVAGMLPMIVGVILLYAPRLHGAALPTAALAIGVVGYFLIVARRLHATASQNISFQAEKDSLIAELEQAKLNSDEARRRAESANLAKSRFLATMSHELRTPLNAILGFSEVMKGELFGPHSLPAYKEYSNDIHASGQHLLMLINEILDLSRVEAGRYELKEEPVSLTAVVEECLRLLWLRIERSDGARIAAHLGGRAGGASGDAQPAEQRHQVHASRRRDHRQGRLDPEGRTISRHRRHRARHSSRGDSDRAVVFRPGHAGAEKCGRRDGPRAADRQGPGRAAWRRVPPELNRAARNRSDRHLPARTGDGHAAGAQRRIDSRSA